MVFLPDVFISHATEDKEKVARPLAEALQESGLDVWYDDFSLNVGDSLQESIDKGINESRFGIVILSKSFFERKWPMKELNGFIAREIHGKNLVIPIWHELNYEDIVKYSPTLADRVALKTSEGMENLVNKIMKKVRTESPNPHTNKNRPIVDIYANKDSILIGKSIEFFGHCLNSGNVVKLTVIGLGEYSTGKEIASPSVSSSGEWRYEWIPKDPIKPGQYIMRVSDSMSRISDEIKFRLEKGAITLVTPKNQIFFIGEKVRLSGTSTVPTKEIYLSIKRIVGYSFFEKLSVFNILRRQNNSDFFAKVKTENDNTWSFVWDTSLKASVLKSGHYSIFASEKPIENGKKSDFAFSSIDIIIEQPFVSGFTSNLELQRGETLQLIGKATGVNLQEVQIWIFGDSFFHVERIKTDNESSYSFTIQENFSNKHLLPGQYYVVIQHPMLNNKFDVYYDESTNHVVTDYPKKATNVFSVVGDESITGLLAVKMLIKAINSSSIDDTCVKLSFKIV